MGDRRQNFKKLRALHSSHDMCGGRRVRASRLRNASAALSDRDIQYEINHGNISIHPLHKRNYNYSSYCVTLGENYYRASEGLDLINPWNKKQVIEFWEGPYKAVRVNEEIFKKSGIPIGKKAIIIPAGASFLAHTQEFIGGLNHIATFLQGRMTMTRMGLNICGDCGWRDIGHINRRVMVIQNTTKTPMIIPVGARIGHIIFFYTGIPNFYHKGETQTTENMHNMVLNWEPSMMLPRITGRKYNIERILKPEYEMHPSSESSKSSESSESSESLEKESEDSEDSEDSSKGERISLD